MLLHLYSAYAPDTSKGKKPMKAGDEERPMMGNGHVRLPNGVVERQAQDAQEFELEGLMSEDEEEAGVKRKVANGRPH